MSGNSSPRAANTPSAVPSLKPLDNWEVAKHQFLMSLESDEEREEIEKLNLNNLEQTIKQQVENSFLAKRLNIFEKTKVNKLVEFMQNHQGAMDVFSNVKPEIICLVWGSVRVVMKIVENDKKYLEQVMGWSELLKTKMPQLEAYERLYDDNPRVMKHLVDTYMLVFQFYKTIIASLRPLQKSSKHRALRGFSKAIGNLKVLTGQTYSDKNSAEFVALLDKLKTAEKALYLTGQMEEVSDNRKRHHDLAERVEVGNEMVVEIDKTTKNTETITDRIGKQVEKLGEKIQQQGTVITDVMVKRLDKNESRALVKDTRFEKETLLRNLSDYSPEDRHHSETNRRVKGTGNWLLADEEFLGWFNCQANGLFLLSGSAGTGKSNITANAVDYIKEQRALLLAEGKRKVLNLAYYYCDDDGEEDPGSTSNGNRRSSITDKLLRALFRQLLGAAELLPEAVKDRLVSWFRSDQGTPLDSEAILGAILDHAREVGVTSIFLFIDGIDELGLLAPTPLMARILSLFRKATTITGFTVKVYLSTRYPAEVHNLLTTTSEFKSEVFKVFEQFMVKANTSPDITAIVVQRVEDAMRPMENVKNPWKFGPLMITDDQLKAEIIATLIDRAGEMILLIDPQLAELCNLGSTDPVLIRQALTTLPRDIQQTYQRIYDRIQLKSKVEKERTRNLIAWVMYARRPLELAEIRDAINVEEDPNVRVLKHQEREEVVLTWLGGYLRVDMTKGGHIVVRIAHQTVKEFFRENKDIIFATGSEAGQMTTGFLYPSERGESMIAKVCMCYINFQCFEKREIGRSRNAVTAKVHEPSKRILESSAQAMDGSGIGGFGKVVLKAASSVAKSVRRSHNIDLTRAFPTSDLEEIPPGIGFTLKDYASIFWIKHVESLQLHPPATECDKPDQWWALFRDIAVSENRQFIDIQPRIWDDKARSYENWITITKKRGRAPPQGSLYRWAVDTGSVLLLRLLRVEDFLKRNMQFYSMVRYDSPILYLLDNNQVEAAVVLATEISTWSKEEQSNISNDLGKSLLFAFINAQVRMFQESTYGAWDYSQTTELVRALLDAGAKVDFADGTSLRKKDNLSVSAMGTGLSKEDRQELKERASRALVWEGHLPADYHLHSTKATVNWETGERDDIIDDLTKKKHPRSTQNTPLHLAAAFGAVESVKLLLQHGAKVDSKNSNGETPLDFLMYDFFTERKRASMQFRIQEAKNDILLVLLEHGALSGLHGEDKDTKLHLALRNLRHPIITTALVARLLKDRALESGSGPTSGINDLNGKGETPLFVMLANSVWNRDLELNGEDYWETDPNNGIRVNKFLTVLRLLNQNGADPNIQRSDGAAVHTLKILPPRVLVELAWFGNSLDLRSSSADGMTPLMRLLDRSFQSGLNSIYSLNTHKYRRVFDFWVYSVNVDPRGRRSRDGETALMDAAAALCYRYTRRLKAAHWTVKELLKLGALDNNERGLVTWTSQISTDSNKLDNDACTPLQLIMLTGDDKLVDLLLSNEGLVISFWDLLGSINIAFSPTIHSRNQYMADLSLIGNSYLTKVMNYDNNLEKTDLNGNTILGYFAKKGDYTVVSFLIQNNANIEHRNQQCKTPLIQALENKHMDIVALLLEKGARCDLVAFDFRLFYAIQSMTDVSLQQTILRNFKKPTSDFSVFEEQLGTLKFEHIQAAGYDILVKNLSNQGLVKLYCLLVSRLYESLSLETFTSFFRSLWTHRPEAFENLGWNRLHQTAFSFVEPRFPNPSYQSMEGEDPATKASEEFLSDCIVNDVSGLTPLHLAVLWDQKEKLLIDFIGLRLRRDKSNACEPTAFRIVDNNGYTPLHLALLFKGNVLKNFIASNILALPNFGTSCSVGDNKAVDRELAASLVRMDLKGGSYWLKLMLEQKKVCLGPDDLDPIMFFGNCRPKKNKYDNECYLPRSPYMLAMWLGDDLAADRPLGTLLHYICAVQGTDTDDKLYQRNQLLVWLVGTTWSDAGPPKFPFIPVNWNLPNAEGKFPIDLLAEFADSNYALSVLTYFEYQCDRDSNNINPVLDHHPVLDRDNMALYRYRPIRHAARRGLPRVVEKLLKLGFRTGRDDTEIEEKTALHYAILGQHTEIVTLLLKHDGNNGLYYPELMEDFRKDPVLRPECLVVESILREREALKAKFEKPFYFSNAEDEDEVEEYWEPLSEGEFDDGDPSCPYPKEPVQPPEDLSPGEGSRLSTEEEVCLVAEAVAEGGVTEMEGSGK